MIRYGIVVHGGAGSSTECRDGCARASEAGLRILKQGGDALDAVIEATVELENDGRFNAGRGAILRLDGQTLEMDASLMTSGGRIGAVAALRESPNPIRVARRVMDTPHVLLAGEGALLFAKRQGLAPGVKPTPEALERHRKLVGSLKSKDRKGMRPEWQGLAVSELWNFPTPIDSSWKCDTVGAVALDQNGRLATANSTGGASPMLLGRVGDSPLPGCGFWCGPEAAVVATGIGEFIIQRMLSRDIYDGIRAGGEPQNVVDSLIGSFPSDVPVGAIAIGSRGSAVKSNREMAFWKETHE